MVTWGTNPSMGVDFETPFPEIRTYEWWTAYHYMDLEPGQKPADIELGYIFICSVPMRVSVIWSWQPSLWKGKKIAPKLNCYCGTWLSSGQASRWKLGFGSNLYGCGLWMAWSRMLHVSRMNPDKVPDGVHCASTSNRNFEDCQGFGAKPISVAQQWPLQQQLLVALSMCAKCQKSSKEEESWRNLPFIQGTTVPLMNDNIDTDQIPPQAILKVDW